MIQIITLKADYKSIRVKKVNYAPELCRLSVLQRVQQSLQHSWLHIPSVEEEPIASTAQIPQCCNSDDSNDSIHH